MKLKHVCSVEEIEQLEPEILKNNLPKVDPIPASQIPQEERNLLSALPFYLLRYGGNLTILARKVPDKKLALVLAGVGKLLDFLARRYKIKE